jgi:ubiquitin-conjugating enzyme E2 J2
MWSVSTILTGLYSFMIETSPTLGSIDTTVSQKHKFASQSLAYNVRDSTFRKLFPEYVELHEQRIAERGLADTMNGDSNAAGITTQDSTAMQFGADWLGVQGVFTTLTGLFVAIVSILFAMRYF